MSNEERLRERFRKTWAAFNGMNEFYQAMMQKFKFSGYIDSSPAPSGLERAWWLRDVIEVLVQHQVLQLHIHNSMSGAYQTRKLIQTLLEEFRVILDSIK